MYNIKPIKLKPSIITTDYIDAKQQFANFGIKRKNLCQRLFTKNKYNIKNPIKSMVIKWIQFYQDLLDWEMHLVIYASL